MQVVYRSEDPNETENSRQGVNVTVNLNGQVDLTTSAKGKNIWGRDYTDQESLQIGGGTWGYKNGTYTITVVPTAPQVTYTVEIWQLKTVVKYVRRTRFKKLPQNG